jgi:O-antigen/teichoic acid export membrane protein
VVTNWIVLNGLYLVIGSLVGAEGVAELRGASLLFAIGNVFFLGIENFVPVQGAKLLRSGGQKALARYLRLWSLFGLAVSIGISAVIAMAPHFWLALFFGASLEGHAELVYGLAVVYPLSSFVTMRGMWLRALSATREVFFVWAWMALATLLSAYPAIRIFGLSGAIGCLLLSYGSGCVAVVLYHARVTAAGSRLQEQEA